jgi:precorrin-3B C17-methyltransferase
MQGPFLKEFDEVLWKNWRIDCVVTKESGEVGGFLAKAEAAYLLGIPLIVVERPQIDYPIVGYDFETVVDQLRQVLTADSADSAGSAGSAGAGGSGMAYPEKSRFRGSVATKEPPEPT